MIFRAIWQIQKQVGRFGKIETVHEQIEDFEIEDIDGKPDTTQAKARATREMKKDPRMAYLRESDKDEDPRSRSSIRWLAWSEEIKGYDDPTIRYYQRKTDWHSEGGYLDIPRTEWTGVLMVGYRIEEQTE